MNSLAYLSRQFDVLASARTPPSTPTSEKATLLTAFDTAKNRPDNHEANPKRTQSWSKPFTPPQEVLDSTGESQRTKRSFSLPAFTVPSVTRKSVQPLSSQSVPPSPVERNGSRLQQRIRRFYLVRAFVLFWNAVCEAWKCIVRRARTRRHGLVISIGLDVDAEDATADEKELDQLVTPTSPRSRSDSRSPLSDTSSLLSEDQPQITSPASSTRSPAYLNLAAPLLSTRTKPSALLPNPFSTSPLTQLSLPPQPFPRSTSPTPSLPPTPPSHPRKTPFHLPKTLVLDLDETLIHSTSRPLLGHGTGGTGLLGLGGRRNKGTGHMVEVVLGGRSTLYHVYKRPFVDYFLRKVSGWYTLVIFTASMQEYADPVIDWLDAGRGILGRRFFRESCTQLPSGSYTKDLSLVEQDLSRVCLVDNSPVSYSVNQANGIPIEGWTHDMSDEALLDLLPVLDSLRFTSDVRSVLGIRGF